MAASETSLGIINLPADAKVQTYPQCYCNKSVRVIAASSGNPDGNKIKSLR